MLIRSGPIFDAHGLKYLVVPGSAGLVASLIIMSVSTGKNATICLVNELTDSS